MVILYFQCIFAFDSYKNTTDVHAPKFIPSINKDNDAKNIQSPTNIHSDKTSVSKISDSTSSSNTGTTDKNLKPKHSVVKNMSRAYIKPKTKYSLWNHPPPSEDLPIVVTNRKDDNLIIKVQYGPCKGRLL